MDELVALYVLAAEARVHAARLEIAAVGTARNLAVAVLPRQPDFEVIGLARGKAHVAAAQQHLAVRQFERLEDLFGGARLAFELGVAVLGTDDRDELDLPELVLRSEEQPSELQSLMR